MLIPSDSDRYQLMRLDTGYGILTELTDVRDMVAVVDNKALPDTLDGLSIASKISTGYMIPIEMELLHEAQAVCFTGPTQIKWVVQLATTDFKYTLHIDGVHKVHYGGWLLVTIGPHVLAKTGKSVRA